MKTSRIKRRTFFAIIAICLITTGVVAMFSTANFRTMNAHAMEFEETIDCEGIEKIDGGEIENESFTEEEESEKFEDIMMLSGGSGRSANEGIISGTTTSTLSFSDLTSVHYIPNANYFLINPWHHDNDASDNGGGTCTTVAMQMLMGYHNYYSDRRIIPTTGNGRTFLNANYGNLDGHPVFQRTTMPVSGTDGQGCLQIGTDDGVYQELFDLTWISSWYGIGQAVGLVKDGAVRFINNYTPQAARNGMSLTSGFFSASTARADIDAGRPIVLGYQPIFTGADSFHVVPAYGYAKLDGVDGFLVHYGWGASRTQVWVPSSWFGFQIRMSTTHTHTFTDTGNNRNNTHRDLTCSVCGATSVDPLYNLSGETISGVRHTLSGSVTIPNSINIYNSATASFASQSITAIGNSAFSGQNQMSQITIPASVKSIGDSAFQYCEKLTDVTIPSSVTSIGDLAFYTCSDLEQITIPQGVIEIGEYAFSMCMSLMEINIANSVYYIKNGAFFGCVKATIYADHPYETNQWAANWNSSNRPVYWNGMRLVYDLTKQNYWVIINTKYCFVFTFF